MRSLLWPPKLTSQRKEEERQAKLSIADQKKDNRRTEESIKVHSSVKIYVLRWIGEYGRYKDVWECLF